MQRLFTLVSAIIVLFSNVLFAQNCPATPTYSNTSGTYDLSVPGRSYVVNNGSTADVNVQSGLSSTSTICVTNGSTLNLSFKNITIAYAGATIYVDATSTLNLVGNSVNNCSYTIINYGTVNQNVIYVFVNGAIINNYGTYNAIYNFTLNDGIISVTNSGVMDFKSGAKFNVGSLSISNLSGAKMTFRTSTSFQSITLSNRGMLECFGSITIQNAATFYNSNTAVFYKGSTLTLNSGSSINNYGLLDARDAVIFNAGSIGTNYCNMLCGSDFKNIGSFTNNGSIMLDTTLTIGSVFQNSGTFVNGPAGFVQGYDFNNVTASSTVGTASVTGGGNFYFIHNTKNSSAFNGSGGSNINFYDVTPCSMNGACSVSSTFDNENVSPKFTTKNKISPYSSATASACGDPMAPVVTVQPLAVTLCDTSTKTVTFSVVAVSPSYSKVRYQWRKDGVDIPGATTGSYTLSSLTLADTANTYTAALTNDYGTVISNSVSVHYLIIAQPAPASLYLATGNSATFTISIAGATAIRWNKNGTAISNATATTLRLPVVTLADRGSYSATVTYSGGTCTSSAATLDASIILYSKASGKMNATATWGVNTDGSGSTPVDFTRDEHTFVVANRSTIANNGSLTIAGKLDLNNGVVTIIPATTLTTGRIIRSGTKGMIAGSATSSLTVQGITSSTYAGASDLYFKAGADTLQYLTIAGHAVTLHTALYLTAGSAPGRLQVVSGSFHTGDALTLNSDALGSAIVASSAGTINGKVTVERFIPARRAWRLLCAPVTALSAPTIHAAWQEGAAGSTDNPHPGYGTHITYGSTADGFDQNPQKTFSMYYYNSAGKWYGIPATNKTPVTSYAAYLFFIRGDRAYDITTTTNTTTPRTTILRTTGYLNQGQQPAIPVSSTGFTLVANPYASPVDFEQIYRTSSNLRHTVRVWDPSLAGTKGVGAYVTLDWTGSTYKATPPSAMTSNIQPYQAFFVQSTAAAAGGGTLSINEAAKHTATVISPFGRTATARQTADALLEINLKVFNEDSTTGIADGVLYRFNEVYSDSVDDEDVSKLSNLYENLSILSSNTLLTVERRRQPAAGDTLLLSLTGTKTTSYQLEIVPQAVSTAGAGAAGMFLYDHYLGQLYPVSSTDTSRFTISINTADALSRAANRFSIVMQQQGVVLPVTFSAARAYASGKTVQVEWKVASEVEVQAYEVERSASGTAFTKAGQVKASGAADYHFTDAAPLEGKSYYRVKSMDKSGKVTYTSILPVRVDNSAVSHLAIYPNPLTGKSFQVHISNKAAGAYTLELMSSSGQQLFTQHIRYTGSTATYNLQLNQPLAEGLYFIKLIAADGSSNVIHAVVQ